MNEQEAKPGISGAGMAEILDALAAAVTVRDLEGRLLYANRRALDSMGYASLEAIQRRTLGSIFDDYVVQDEHGRALVIEDMPSVRLLEGGAPEPLVIRTVSRVTGETHWNLLKSAPLRDEQGKPVAAVTIIEDITSEKTSERRDHFLAEATATLMSSLDYEETLRNVGWLAVPEIADWCAVNLLDEHGALRRVVVAHRDPAKLELAERLQPYTPQHPDPGSGVGLALRTGNTVLYEDVDDEALVAAAVDDEHLRLLRAVGMRSVLLVPLRARGRTLGALTLVSSDSLRRFSSGDRHFAEQLASRAALAVDNARLATAQRSVADTLQRSLLPEQVPRIAGWETATLYRAAASAEGIEVGGDFFDFVPTPAGWLALLGDVTGRGLAASAMTLLVRHGARFAGRHETSPAEILAHINEALRDQGSLSLVTAVCARLHEGRFVFSSAGHPSPLVLSPDGQIRELARTGPLLGAWDAAWDERVVEVEAGDTLFMYTDGLIELRGARERFGTARLRGLLQRAAGATPEELLQELQRELDAFRVEDQADDTAAVALRYRPVPT